MKVKEAIKRLRQETAPATYMPDFDKEECLKIIEKDIDRLERLEFNLQRWFILLGKGGMNSKAIVRDEIEAVLEEMKNA